MRAWATAADFVVGGRCGTRADPAPPLRTAGFGRSDADELGRPLLV